MEEDMARQFFFFPPPSSSSLPPSLLPLLLLDFHLPPQRKPTERIRARHKGTKIRIMERKKKRCDLPLPPPPFFPPSPSLHYLCLGLCRCRLPVVQGKIGPLDGLRSDRNEMGVGRKMAPPFPYLTLCSPFFLIRSLSPWPDSDRASEEVHGGHEGRRQTRSGKKKDEARIRWLSFPPPFPFRFFLYLSLLGRPSTSRFGPDSCSGWE